MAQDKEKATTDGTYADGDLVQVPLVNLELGPNYRSQLRDMHSLVESVYQFGVLTPLWVQPHPTKRNKYVVFSGRRRYEAARQAAQRRARESSSDEALAVQVGRYAVPCRIFRNLSRGRQAVFALVENLVRTDASSQDTAREIARARTVIEEEMGRKVSVEEMMTLFEGAGRQPGKSFHRQHVYKLLRMAELDANVLEAAREHSIAMDYLLAIARLPTVKDQLGLIESIQKEGLTRQEVRSLVNHMRSHGDKEPDLAALIAQVRGGCEQRADGRQVEIVGGAEDQGNIAVESPAGPDGEALAAAVDSVAEGRSEDPERVEEPGRGGLRPLGEGKDIEDRNEPSEGLTVASLDAAQVQDFPVGDPLAITKAGAPFPWAREDWLKEVEARCGREEAGSVEKAVGQEVAYTLMDIALMRAVHKYGSVPPEYLVGYLENVKEATSGSPWFRRVVACSLELLGLLEQDREFQRLRWMPRRAFAILLQGFCRAAEGCGQEGAPKCRPCDGRVHEG